MSPTAAAMINRFPSFPNRHKSGILTALPEHDNRPILYRKPFISSSSSSTSSQLILSISKPPNVERAQSMPSRKHQYSALKNVLVMSIAMAKKSKFYELDEVEDDDEILPPHEIVARELGVLKTTFSVLEGVGRTLKGRDLCQVRNAVFRQTGFLD